MSLGEKLIGGSLSRERTVEKSTIRNETGDTKSDFYCENPFLLLLLLFIVFVPLLVKVSFHSMMTVPSRVHFSPFTGGIPLLFLVDRRSGTFMWSLQFPSPITWLSTSSIDTCISTSLSSSIVGCFSFSVLFGFVISGTTFIPSFDYFSSNVTLRLIIILFVYVCSSLYPFDRSLQPTSTASV